MCRFACLKRIRKGLKGDKKGAKRLTTINLLARLGRISPFLKADKCKPFCSSSVSILGQKHPRHTAEPLKNLSQVVFFREFGDLSGEEGPCQCIAQNGQINTALHSHS